MSQLHWTRYNVPVLRFDHRLETWDFINRNLRRSTRYVSVDGETYPLCRTNLCGRNRKRGFGPHTHSLESRVLLLRWRGSSWTELHPRTVAQYSFRSDVNSLHFSSNLSHSPPPYLRHRPMTSGSPGPRSLMSPPHSCHYPDLCLVS